MFRPILIAALLLSPAPALACGGFFCDAVIDPVVQTAERVLFRVNPDDTVTTVVEIQFEGEPIDFGWVLPVSAAIDPDAVTTAPAGLFDELEELSSPRFVLPAYESAMSADAAGLYMPMMSGCGAGCGNGAFGVDDGFGGVVPDLSGVEVVGNAVAGPYAIEIITAESADNLVNWLQFNGYQVPSSAMEPIATYVSAGMSFLGLKLQPDVPAGPIDALSFTYPAEGPMLPLVLTSVAAVADMEITAYVLADERYAPANYLDVPFEYGDLSWTDDGTTNYDDLLPTALDLAGGQAFVTEFARPVAEIVGTTKRTAGLLSSGTYLTRFKTVISPEEMTLDPGWIPAPHLDDVNNIHAISDDRIATASPAGLWVLIPMLLLASRRRN